MTVSVQPMMTVEEFRLIKEYVAETYGLLLDYGKEDSLAAKLLPRMKDLGLHSFYEYYSYLKFAPQSKDEAIAFISLLTNNETYFFREDNQLKLLSDEVLPALKEQKLKKGDRKLRILSAGCSSGEEVYSLAMVLLEAGFYTWSWDMKIIGLDINPHVLEKARLGVYNGRTLQTAPADYVAKYFRKGENGFSIKESVRSICEFNQGNLLECHSILMQHEIDIIFCRNVLIYFRDETVQRIVESFIPFMTTEGLLFLGHSESLARITNRYFPVRFPGSIIYRLRG